MSSRTTTTAPFPPSADVQARCNEVLDQIATTITRMQSEWAGNKYSTHTYLEYIGKLMPVQLAVLKIMTSQEGASLARDWESLLDDDKI